MEYQKHIYVLDAEDHPICAVNGLQYDSDNYTDNFLGISELTFTVNRYVWIPYPFPQLIESTGYEYLMEGMSLYITDIGIFKITDVSRSDDSYAETKEVTCRSCEMELQNRDAVTFYVNTGITGSKEMMAEGNLSNAGLPMEAVLIYNEKNPQLSFLDLVLDECPDWSVGYVDPLLLTKAVLPMEIESQNVYSVLMEEFSQNNKVVVTFDRKHRKVNCYSHERINIINDTNIFIRYENLANSVDIKRHNEGIYTRFNVVGADGMEISQINLGESRIEDLRWIVSQKSKSGRPIYVTKDLSEKYINWYNTREELRKQYAEKSKEYNQYIIDINEIQTKDCMDALKIDLSTYSDEELSGLKESYILTCNVLCADYSVRDEEGNQVLDDEGYAEISDMDGFKSSPYYADYVIYKETLIPNIEIEQENRIINSRSDLTSSEKKDLYKDALNDWETDWSLYGIDSLEAKLKVYESNINILKEKNYQLAWDELSESQKTGFNSIDWGGQHEIYLENVDNYNGCLAALTDLKEKKAILESERDNINSERIQLVKDASKTNPSYGFTESELKALSRLLRDTDYQNDSYGTTSVDDVVSALDKQEELFQAATTELEIESQEQLGFEISLDNLFNIPGFELWRPDFSVGKFVRVGVLDNYYIRLRLITIQRSIFNPESNDITVTFSNLLKSNGSLSDINTVFKTAISSAKNQIEATYRSDKTLSEIFLSDDILRALANSPTFSNSVTNIVADSIRAKTGVFEALTSDYAGVDALEASIAKINTATIDVLFGKYNSTFQGDFIGLNADTIKAGTLSVERLLIRPTEEQLAASPDIKSILFEINNIGELASKELTDAEAEQMLLHGRALVAESVTADKIHAHTIVTDLLDAEAIKSFSYSASDGEIYSNNGTMFYLGGLTSGGTPIENTAYIKSKNFAIDTAGNAYFRGSGSFDGTIKANDGNIGPWTIVSTAIYKGSSSWGTSGGMYFGNSGLSISDKFKVDASGNLTSTGTMSFANGNLKYDGSTLTINGSVTANIGSIGGWNIDSTRIYKSTTDGDNKSKYVFMSSNFYTSANDVPYNPVFGVKYDNTWQFYVRSNGELYAKNANIEGKITATSGSIAGNLVTSGINANNLTTGVIKSSNYAYSSGNYSTAGTCLDLSNGVIRSKNFGIDSSGNAYFKGNMTATSGNIGGFTITSSSLCNGTNSISSTSAGVYLGTNGFRNYKDDTHYTTISDGVINTQGGIFNSGVFNKGTFTDIVLKNNVSLQYAEEIITYTAIQILNSGAGEILTDHSMYFGNGQLPIFIVGSPLVFKTYNNSEHFRFWGVSNTCNGTIVDMGTLNAQQINENGVSLSSKYVSSTNGTLTWKLKDESISVALRRSGSSGSYGLSLVTTDASGNNTFNTLITSSGGRNWALPDHTHNYLPLTGGVLSGTLKLKVSNGGTGYYAVGSADGSAVVSNISCHTNTSGTYYLTVVGKFDNINESYESHSIVSASSDARLKYNISNSNIYAMDVINAMQVRQFTWKQKNSYQKIGFVADELEKLDPKLAFGGGYNPDGSMNIKSVDTFYLLGYVVKGMQELYAENKALQQELMELKQKYES